MIKLIISLIFIFFFKETKTCASRFGDVMLVSEVEFEPQHVIALKHKAFCHFNLSVPEGAHKIQGC